VRKRRTREHVIADLSVNHVERSILKCGYVADRVLFDYGFDLIMRTFDSDGFIEPDFVLFQLKASDTPEYVEEGRIVTVRLDARDIETWQAERVPVILVLYDANLDRAYWLDFKNALSIRASVRIATDQIVNEMAIRAIRSLKPVLPG